MIARDKDRLAHLAKEIPDTRPFACDVTDTEKLHSVVKTVQDEMGPPKVLIHNAVGGIWGDILTVDPGHLDLNFRVNTMALLHLVQAVGPAMVDSGAGTILATGNTSAYRGSAQFAAFAPSKAAQRILMESAARELGPKGVHVAYVAIDAVINVPWTRVAFPDQPDEYFCEPSDIAKECFHVAHQPRSAWSSSVVIRPYGEKW
jgi:NADP-dependent 3-hydroxy acid dehydrogenase YdfG